MPLNFSVWMTVISVLMMGMVLISLSNMGMAGSNSLSFDQELIFMNSLMSTTNTNFFKLVSLISVMIFTWGLFYTGTHKAGLFYFSLLMFVLSMLLLTLSNSMLMVFLGWEGLGITSFILIIFYQNWMSAKGGLLTLLTNRLGDAIMLIMMGGLMAMAAGDIIKSKSTFLIVIFSILTLTKSAQWPFISWLPAAMAAPTPVSSLVHSSTLVTAGVWLMIRFTSTTSFNTKMWGALGLLTLTVASFSALLEVDAKKIVALSTLSQLGLMFMSLSLGMVSICFFHILMHALAKANLFMVVGSLLHMSFSQQDSRSISSSTLGHMMTISMSISLFSLVGLAFTSGFYSKEQALMGHSFLMNSFMSNLIIILVISMTMSYCLKLFISSMKLNTSSLFQSNSYSANQFIPIFILSMLVVTTGINFNTNMAPYYLSMESLEGLYWVVMMLGVLFLFLSFLNTKMLYYGFYSQLKMIDLGLNYLSSGKSLSLNLESSGSEMIYLFSSFFLIKIMKQGMRTISILSALMAILVLI